MLRRGESLKLCLLILKVFEVQMDGSVTTILTSSADRFTENFSHYSEIVVQEYGYGIWQWFTLVSDFQYIISG